MKYPPRCSLIRCFSLAGTAWGYGLVWMEATDLLEPLLEGTLCYKMTQGRPSLGVRVCSGARERVRAQGTSLSSTTLNPGAASRLGTHAVPAQPGTAFQPLIYHPITCLFCCICRPFTAAIYQERSQRQKREWCPPPPHPSPTRMFPDPLLDERTVGGWTTVTSQLLQTALSPQTVVIFKSCWATFEHTSIRLKK